MPADRGLAADLADVLVELYSSAQTRLAAEISRRLAAGLDTPDWADRKLIALGGLRTWIERFLSQLQQDSRPEIDRMLVLAHRRGADAALAELRRLGSGVPGQAHAIEQAFPGIGAFHALAFSLASTLHGTHLRILRWSLDAYREVVTRATADVSLGIATRRRAAQVAWEQLLSRGITGFVDKSGRRWELASYVEMATRTIASQAAIEAHLHSLGEAGIDLVVVSDAPQECNLCLVPGTVVEGPAPTWRTRLEYSGDVVSITTATGNHLTGTPNHTVLTPHGWRALQDLRPGDQVISHNGQQRYPGVMPDDVQVPALIEHAGEARAPLLLAGPTCRDLDQNRAYREVRCVAPKRDLMAVQDAAFVEPLGDQAFVSGVGAASARLAVGDPFLALLGDRLSAGSGVSRTEHGGSLLRTGLTPALVHTPGGQFGPLFMGERGHMSSHGVSSRPSLHSSPTQVVADHSAADAEGGAELLRALASDVTIDEVLSVGRREFRGHVWDLSTEPAWFVANGIVTHNCRPWEGKVLTRDRPGGTWGPGKQTLQAQHAIHDRMVPVHVAGSVREAIAAGLFHPACRHTISGYLPGVTTIPTHTADPAGDEARQRQRALERSIRKAKTQAAASIDPAARPVLEAKVRAAQAKLRDHLADHPDLKRLRYREQIGVAR